MKTRQKLNKEIERQIDKYLEQRKNLADMPIELVEQAFPQGHWQDWWGSAYQFVLPLSFQLVEDFKEFCHLQGWRHTDPHQIVWDSGHAGVFMYVSLLEEGNLYPQFEVAFRSEKKGSTCVLNVIGTKEVPVYEVTCPEGAEENIWKE